MVQERIGLPRWLRPAVAGALLGGLAIFYPHIIGVGYETTFLALNGRSAAARGDRLCHPQDHCGGDHHGRAHGRRGLFALADGRRADGAGLRPDRHRIFPDVSGALTLYALAGMGAVAAAVLGAPISTTLIVFELTGDWQTGLAVMVAVSMSTALASRLVDRSFFLTQLERRNIHLAAGPQAYLLAMFRAGAVMRPPDHPRAAVEETCRDMIRDGVFIDANATLETAMPLFEGGAVFVPVVRWSGEPNNRNCSARSSTWMRSRPTTGRWRPPRPRSTPETGSDLLHGDVTGGVKREVVLDPGDIRFRVLVGPGHVLQRRAFGHDREVACRRPCAGTGWSWSVGSRKAIAMSPRGK